MILWSNYSIVAGAANTMNERNSAENKQLLSKQASGDTMAPPRVRSKSLHRRYKDETRTLTDLAMSLPGRPTSDDIHDLRVAARRTQVIRRLLPRDFRESQVSQNFDFVLKSALKSTSQLRDLDTLSDTLRSHRTNLPPELLVNLDNQRSDLAARAGTACAVITGTPVPDFDPSGIRGKKLSRRLKKSAKKRGRVASQLLAEVLNDESKVDELHALRKEVKKLRYLLELADGGSDKLPKLTKWQDSLGSIHDLDVAVSYLEKSHFDSKQAAIRELRRVRHERYLKFVRDYKTDLLRVLGDDERLPFVTPSDSTVTL